MNESQVIEAKAARVSALIEEKLGVRGPDLKRQVTKLGRRVPRAVRNDIQVLAHAVDFVGHPKLSRQVNLETLSQAEDRIVAYLAPIDPKDRRRDAILGWLGSNAFNLLVLFGLTVFVLRARGYL
ncbi:hypothetical protein [Primorskyibacter sp. S187A]|uniref:hypothetical protein n=1 Tax=Primorskyibacter sp. S187A TaxID=3415130 RepID=UPI003C7A5182